MVTPVRLTPQKQQELQSIPQIMERFATFGWPTTRPDDDFGEDLIVHIYFDGKASGVLFHLQAKSVTNLDNRRQGKHIPYRFKVKDMLHWEQFALPVVLLVWDVNLREGRWRLLDTAVAQLDETNLGWREQKTATVYLPWQNGTDDWGLIEMRKEIGRFLYPQLTNNKPLATSNPECPNPPAHHMAEAKQLAKLLAEKFEAKAVYLFGSLVWATHWNSQTDIDLAVCGLAPEKFFKAIGFLEDKTQFPFDLVDLNSVSPPLRERILAEGKLLYER